MQQCCRGPCRGVVGSTSKSTSAAARLARAPTAPPVGVCTASVDFFCPWTQQQSAVQLPEHVQGYLSLLAESCTYQGGMSKHLVKMMAQGAGIVSKMDVLDTVCDLVADAGTELLLDKVNKQESGWNKLRMAVKCSKFFKAAGKAAQTRDDSYTPPREVDPAHSKALRVLVSIIMSGAISGAAHAVTGGDGPGTIASPFLPQHSPEVVQTVKASTTSATSNAFSNLQQHLSASVHAAPSLHSMPSLRTDGSALLGSGGMAATTAMKLLRADSRGLAAAVDLQDLLDPVLKSVEECGDDMVSKLARAMPKDGLDKGGATAAA